MWTKFTHAAQGVVERNITNFVNIENIQHLEEALKILSKFNDTIITKENIVNGYI